jgi:signal transduction histidine kinase
MLLVSKRSLQRLSWITMLLILVMSFQGIAFAESAQSTRISDSEQVQSLAGEWEFYWKQLLEPTDFQTSDQQQVRPNPDFIQVPSSWVGQKFSQQTNGGQPLPRAGYATYRTQLQLQAEQVGVSTGLFFRYVDSAFRIWVDGKEYEGSGVVATTASAEQPRLAMNLIYFTPTKPTVEIVIQVSNGSFRESGIVGETLWGPADTLTRHVFKSIALQDIFFISCFLLLGMYHLIVYFSRRNERSFLWLGILNICMAIRSFLISEYLAMLIFPSFTWEQIIRIEYFVEAIGVTSLVLLFHVLYPKDTHRLPKWITIGYTLMVLIYIASTPTIQFTSTFFLQWIIYLLILAYYLIYIGIVTVIRRREGAYLNMIGLLVVIVGVLNDLFFYSGEIETVALTSISMLIFFFIQALILAFRYATMFRQNVDLKNELSAMNSQLEKTVNERTEQLRQSVEQLTEMDSKRTQLLENIAHDMGSPVVGLQTHIYVMQNRQLTADQQTQALQLMQMNVENLKRQAEDLYDLTGIERNSDAVIVQPISILDLWQQIYAYLQEKVTWQQIQWQPGEMIDFQSAEASYKMNINLAGILRVLQNYLDNAIKFSMQEPCFIQIDYRIRDNQLDFALTDHGKGIPADELPSVFERFYKGTGNRKGIGLGLAIAKEIIERHGGTVGVQSEEGRGSTFSFTIPLIDD